MADKKNPDPNQTQDKLNSLGKESEQPNIPSESEIDDFQDDSAIDKLLMDNIPTELDELELPKPEELSEIDEFSEDDDPEITPQAESLPTNTQADAAAPDDLHLDDFDITSDTDNSDSSEGDMLDDFFEPTKETAFESQTIQDVLNLSDTDQNSKQEAIAEQTPTIEKTSATSAIITETLTAQVSQLWAELEEIKQQPSSSEGDIEQLTKKLKKTVQEQEETNKKNKLFANIAMAIAALSSIIAIAAIIQNSNLKTTVTDMNGLITDIEETASGPGIATDKLIKNLKDSHLLLDNNQQSLRIQLATLKNQLNSKTTEPDQNEIEMQNSLSNLQKQVADINNKIKNLSTATRKLNKPRPKKTVKKASKSKAKPTATWTVNLISFKQEWYARKKAAEFKNKGIPVEVAHVEVKGEQWYRLRVTGFKTKYEAGSYASRAKKSLNLSSVWVAQ
jgi:predicted transcriptional regulator